MVLFFSTVLRQVMPEIWKAFYVFFFFFFKLKPLFLINCLVSLKREIKNCSESYRSIFSRVSDALIENSKTHQETQKRELSNCFLYKLKKWSVHSKRLGNQTLKASFLLSYENEQIVCKICAKSVFAKTIKEHSAICMKLTETKMDVKTNTEKLNNEIIASLIKDRRSYHIQTMIMK